MTICVRGAVPIPGAIAIESSGRSSNHRVMMRTADRWMRMICGIAGSLGFIVASLALFREGIAGITWLHGIRYLAVTFVCYVLLRVGIKGECPAWLDI